MNGDAEMPAFTFKLAKELGANTILALDHGVVDIGRKTCQWFMERLLIDKGDKFGVLIEVLHPFVLFCADGMLVITPVFLEGDEEDDDPEVDVVQSAIPRALLEGTPMYRIWKERKDDERLMSEAIAWSMAFEPFLAKAYEYALATEVTDLAETFQGNMEHVTGLMVNIEKPKKDLS